jgi:signal transduction histidine kinase
MGAAGGVALLFLPAAARNGARLNTAGHHNIGLWVSLTPWVLLGVATILGTAAEIEDRVFRRRMVLGGAAAMAFVAMGYTLQATLPPDSGVFRAIRSALFVGAFWLSPMRWFIAFRGVGRWADKPLEKWLGPAVSDSETALRAREREIREAAGLAERTRLAQDLHDSIKQEIFAIHTSAATIQERLTSDPEGARQAIEQVRRSSRDAMTEIEAMLDRLDTSPLENTGLVSALRKQCEALGLRTGAEVTCVIGQLPASKLLPPGTHEALFRIAQEALSNIGKHARATHVRLTLELAERFLLLTVTDDGQGFDKREPTAEARLGMGLKNMLARSRSVGGRFELVTSPGHGATIRVDVPVLQPSIYFDGVPRWMVWAIYGVGGVPMVVAGYLMVTNGGRIDWTAAVFVLLYVLFMIYSFRRGMGDLFKP